MKKFAVLLSIFLWLSFNVIGLAPAMAAEPIYANTFKEGVYKLSDFAVSTDQMYTAKNTSASENAYLLLFDENQILIQSIRLAPSSIMYNLLPLKPEYRIVIIGGGDVNIIPQKQ
ncbi:MAG: hypothetical protein ABRQ25_05700 [Clostridiaceae bacterium]